MIPDDIRETGRRLLSQNNQGTAEPMFCVQGLERIGPIMPEYACGDLCFHDSHQSETYYHDGFDRKRWAELQAMHLAGTLPGHVTAGGYVDRWVTVQVCFTEEGCKRYLDANGHNVRRQYLDVRTHVESFRRNPEMTAIRGALMALAEPSFEEAMREFCKGPLAEPHPGVPHGE